MSFEIEYTRTAFSHLRCYRKHEQKAIMDTVDRQFQSNGDFFEISQVDEYSMEVELLKNSSEFMAFMEELTHDEDVMSPSQIRQELGL